MLLPLLAAAAVATAPQPPAEPQVTISLKLFQALYAQASKPSCEAQPLITEGEKEVLPQIEAMRKAQAEAQAKAAPK